MIYDGDIEYFLLEKTKAVQHAQKETQIKGLPPNEADNYVWQANDIKPISLDNELKMWDIIKFECQMALSKFPQSLQEDIDILA